MRQGLEPCAQFAVDVHAVHELIAVRVRLVRARSECRFLVVLQPSVIRVRASGFRQEMDGARVVSSA